MAEETKKPAAKKAATPKKTPAKTAAKKTAAKKAEAKTETAKPVKIAAKKELKSGLKVTQTGSGIGRGQKQNATLKGLGLGKMNRTRIVPDTPSTRGMINKVSHLVSVEQVG